MSRRRRKPRPAKFRVIDGCPCPASIAPYVYLVVRRAGQTASSIYRGEEPEAVAILHRHGKRTQREIHADPALRAISNPSGFSEHELRSDGPAANEGIPRGEAIPEWMQGVDSGRNDRASRERVTAAARHYGWRVEHPYSAGVEGHHWRFARRPRNRRIVTAVRIAHLRATLPRR